MPKTKDRCTRCDSLGPDLRFKYISLFGGQSIYCLKCRLYATHTVRHMSKKVEIRINIFNFVCLLILAILVLYYDM